MSHKSILLAVLPLLTGALADHQVSIDLTGVDESIAPFVIAIDYKNLETRPNCSDLEIEIFKDNGGVEKIKPTSVQRDEAWEFYQAAKDLDRAEGEAVQDVKLKENDAGLVSLKFLTFFDGYRKDEIAGFTQERARELLSYRPEVVEQSTPE